MIIIASAIWGTWSSKLEQQQLSFVKQENVGAYYVTSSTGTRIYRATPQVLSTLNAGGRPFGGDSLHMIRGRHES